MPISEYLQDLRAHVGHAMIMVPSVSAVVVNDEGALLLGRRSDNPVTYPHGDKCEYMNVWFRCTATGGQARVNDEESLEMEWFAPDALPPLDDFATLRIETALKDDPAVWFAQPGATHPALRINAR